MKARSALLLALLLIASSSLVPGVLPDPIKLPSFQDEVKRRR